MTQPPTPWDRPLPPPTYDHADERATAGTRHHPDADAGYHATVTLVGVGCADQVVTLHEVQRVLERAARYRRSLAEGKAHPNEIEAEITAHVIVNQQPSILPSGWAKIGFVLDPWAAPDQIHVWWHPDDDRVRVTRPEPRYARYVAPPAPSVMPIRLAPEHDPFRAARPVHASPGYVYTFEGEDYSPEAAEAKASEACSVVGWTWRRA